MGKYIMALDQGTSSSRVIIFNPNEENPVLLPIETEEEWKLIEAILTSLSGDEQTEE